MTALRSLLEVREATKVFTSGFFRFQKRIVAVDKASFSISGDKPTIFTLAGESGSGKTTIARMVLGFISPDEGEIIYDGKSIFSLTKEEWKDYRRKVQAVFQDPYSAYNPVYTVDHVLYTPIRKFKLVESDEEAREMVEKALESVGLRHEEVLGRYPYQLSGGQRQRVLLARSLLLKPRLMVADEPVSMLDTSLRAGILNLMIELKEKLGVSFLYITHDLSTASYLSDYIAIMYRGTIVETGPIDDIIEEPLHPYTKLLIESIPIPNPSKRWGTRIELPPREFSEEKTTGCKFFDRCPNRMDVCREKRPPAKPVGSRSVACFLY
jgi:peptide/nickel transport system ATP-binding protein